MYVITEHASKQAFWEIVVSDRRYRVRVPWWLQWLTVVATVVHRGGYSGTVVATVATATRTTEEEGDTGAEAEAAAGPAGRSSTKPAV